MKILMITTDFPYRTDDGTIIQGGGSECVAQLVGALIKRGFEIVILTRKERKYAKELFDIKIYRTRSINLGFRESKITHSVTALAPALNIMRKEKPDIIHSHNPPAALVAIACAKLFKKPHILTMHGPWSGVRIKKITKTIARLIEKFAVKNADIVTCDSVALKQDMDYSYKINARAIQNAIEAAKFKIINQKSSRKKLGVKTKDNIVLFTGRFVAEKGLHNLLEAAKSLLNRYNNLTFLLIGGGFDEHIIKDWLRKNSSYNNKIIVIPFLKKEMMNYAYRAADIFVLPSLAEGLSRSLMEAMACEIPCIATSVGGNTELLKDGSGLLVKSNNSSELAKIIEKLITDKKLAKKFGKEGRKTVVKDFSVEKRVNEFIKIYNSVI